jgi:fatty-acyl-CoA synthase
MPLFHTAGCCPATLGALQTGGVHVLATSAEPATLLELIEAERGTHMLCVPTMLLRVRDHQDAASRDLTSWRLCTLGGAPVAAELAWRARECLGVKVAIGYGQTEASPYVTHTLPDDRHPDWISTVGRPLPQTEIRIADPGSGAILKLGAIGEIRIRSYGVMRGYFDDPDATASALDEAGWLRTGDLGSKGERGYCRIQGRLKDMIIRGGENIYPREVEDVLFNHPAVANVAVVGLPDTEWGEIVAAFVQARPGMAPDGAARHGAGRRGARTVLPPPSGVPQGAAALALRVAVSADRLRQAAEVHAARTGIAGRAPLAVVTSTRLHPNPDLCL